ncbi:MAG TPA: DUF3570 domain-containing protein [Usitatibacter sp.]|nr:DUF3570 domain-containing protein [Usitatibacter sp.]
MAATEDAEEGRRPRAPLAALTQAALALPIVLASARAGAAQVGEVGFAALGYKERGLIKVTEPVLWGRLQVDDVWEFEASGALDIVTGASPELVTNLPGTPVQSVTGASINDRRRTAQLRAKRRFGDFSLSVSRAVSNEEDYHSHAFAIQGEADLDQHRTTLAIGLGKSNDRVGSSIDPALDERRDTREYLAGVTQVLSPLAVVQSTLTVTRGKGWFNDPYKSTLTFYPDEILPVLFADRRPDHRNAVAWLTRYRRHFPGASGTLQADYRLFRDDWGIRAHTLELAWQQDLGERWSIRPALRYYTQGAADFYSPVVPRPRPEVLSSDQRLGAFGGLSPSLRLVLRLENGLTVEGTAGYVHDAASLRLGGGGSEAFTTLRAVYGILSLSRAF